MMKSHFPACRKQPDRMHSWSVGIIVNTDRLSEIDRYYLL